MSWGRKIAGTVFKVTQMQWWDKFGIFFRWLKCLNNNLFHYNTTVQTID
jgi:hypothetical protein